MPKDYSVPHDYFKKTPDQKARERITDPVKPPPKKKRGPIIGVVPGTRDRMSGHPSKRPDEFI